MEENPYKSPETNGPVTSYVRPTSWWVIAVRLCVVFGFVLFSAVAIVQLAVGLFAAAGVTRHEPQAFVYATINGLIAALFFAIALMMRRTDAN